MEEPKYQHKTEGWIVVVEWFAQSVWEYRTI